MTRTLNPATVNTIADELWSNQLGATVTLDGTQPTTGYVLADGKTGALIDPIGIHGVRTWVRDAVLDGATAFGVWTDSESGQVWYDRVEVVADRRHALELGAARGEIAIWDIAANDEIRVADALAHA